MHLNLKQAAAGFQVSDITVLNWRAGTKTKEKLPVVEKMLGNRRRVFFDSKACSTFAKKHGLEFDLAKAQAADSGEQKKPGPKPTAAAPAKKTPAKKTASTTSPATKKAATKKA